MARAEKNYRSTPFENYALWAVIILPSLVLIAALGAVLYFLTSDFSSRLNNATIRTLQDNSRQQIDMVIQGYLGASETLVLMNAGLYQDGIINVEELQETGRLFLNQVKENRLVDYAYFANAAGGIVSSGKSGGRETIAYTDGMVQSSFAVYDVAPDGQLRTIKTVEDFDPRKRSWYLGPQRPGEIFWTEVYSGAQESVLGISASTGVFAADGIKIGVFGSDILLDEISDYFKKIRLTENARIYLLEANGDLIVDTGLESPFCQGNGGQQRITAGKSKDELLGAIFTIASGGDTPANIRKILAVGQERFYVDINRLEISETAFWTYAIVIPEKDVLGDYFSLKKRLEVSIAGALLLMAGVSILIYLRISFAIRRVLSEIAAMVEGKWGSTIETGRHDLLGDLIRSFNKMSKTLSRLFVDLEEKNVELKELNLSLEARVEERSRQLRELSITDDLTGLYNRRYLMEILNNEFSSSKRYDSPLSLCLFDIDRFKAINDTFGHLVGDEVLMMTAGVLQQITRDADTVGRYGGEEFLLIMPRTAIDQAIKVAERYRREIRDTQFANPELDVSISGGVAELRPGEALEILISRVDFLLYEAKNNGRNRIEA